MLAVAAIVAASGCMDAGAPPRAADTPESRGPVEAEGPVPSTLVLRMQIPAGGCTLTSNVTYSPTAGPGIRFLAYHESGEGTDIIRGSWVQEGSIIHEPGAQARAAAPPSGDTLWPRYKVTLPPGMNVLAWGGMDTSQDGRPAIEASCAGDAEPEVVGVGHQVHLFIPDVFEGAGLTLPPLPPTSGNAKMQGTFEGDFEHGNSRVYLRMIGNQAGAMQMAFDDDEPALLTIGSIFEIDQGTDAGSYRMAIDWTAASSMRFGFIAGYDDAPPAPLHEYGMGRA